MGHRCSDHVAHTWNILVLFQTRKAYLDTQKAVNIKTIISIINMFFSLIFVCWCDNGDFSIWQVNVEGSAMANLLTYIVWTLTLDGTRTKIYFYSSQTQDIPDLVRYYAGKANIRETGQCPFLYLCATPAHLGEEGHSLVGR